MEQSGRKIDVELDEDGAPKGFKRTLGAYGPMNFLDFLVPDSDPNLKYMEKEPEERTVRRYAHNRKKVYLWEQVGILFATIAVTIGVIFIQGGPNVEAINDVLGPSGAAGLTTLFGALSFAANYISFRTDIKNDVDLEELMAKRTGKYVGLAVAQELEKTHEPNLQKPPNDLLAHTSSPTVETAPEARGIKPATDAGAPDTKAFHAILIERLMQAPAHEKTH